MSALSQKLVLLADSAKYDASCASTRSSRDPAAAPGICHSYTPDGRCVSLLKVLLTNYCIYDCAYCVNRASNDVPRARFAVDEVVRLTVDFYQRNYIDGLFLSSGVIQSPDYHRPVVGAEGCRHASSCRRPAQQGAGGAGGCLREPRQRPAARCRTGRARREVAGERGHGGDDGRGEEC